MKVTKFTLVSSKGEHTEYFCNTIHEFITVIRLLLVDERIIVTTNGFKNRQKLSSYIKSEARKDHTPVAVRAISNDHLELRKP